MIDIIWSFLKTFGPYVAIVLLAGLLWMLAWTRGYHTADSKRVAQLAVIEERAAVAEADAKKKTKQIEDLNTHAQQTSIANREIIEAYTDPNRKLLDARVRYESAKCPNILPRDTFPARSSNGATSSGAGSFLASVGKSIGDSARECDLLVESLRACRTYATNIREILNERNSNSNQ